MKKYFIGLAVLVLLAAGPAQSGEGVTPMLKMGTTWAFTWEGTLHGDFNGVIRWWVEFPLTGVGRWELWDCEPVYPASDCQDPARLVMAGYDAFGYVSATEWEGKGVVTYVNPGYPELGEWFGRRISDGGYVNFDDGVPIDGEGWFTIYNTPSNKH